MIIYEGDITDAAKAAKKIIWLYGAKWSTGKLEDFGIDEKELTEEDRIELIEQLKKQESRVKGLFGI